MIQFDPKTGNTRKIRRVGRDSCWKKLRRKANELAWLIETGRTQRVVFAQYEKKRKELHRSMDRRDYHVNDLYKDSGHRKTPKPMPVALPLTSRYPYINGRLSRNKLSVLYIGS
eukprot:s9078_g1.t1